MWRDGNAIDFLMNYDKLEFVETVKSWQQCTILKCHLKQAAAPADRAPSEANALSVDGRSEYVYQQSLQQPVATSARQYLEKRD